MIAGQEIWSNSPISKDNLKEGKERVSQLSSYEKSSRRKDIERYNNLIRILQKCEIDRLIKTENKLKFCDKQKISGTRIWWLTLFAKYYKNHLLATA